MEPNNSRFPWPKVQTEVGVSYSRGCALCNAILDYSGSTQLAGLLDGTNGLSALVQEPKLIWWKMGFNGPLITFSILHLSPLIVSLGFLAGSQGNYLQWRLLCIQRKVFSFCSEPSCYVCATQLEGVGQEPRDPCFFCSCPVLGMESLGDSCIYFCTYYFACSVMSLHWAQRRPPSESGCGGKIHLGWITQFLNVVKCFTLLIWPIAITLDNISHTFTHMHTTHKYFSRV